ncbi:unnamed protein product [Sphagnum jensenii]
MVGVAAGNCSLRQLPGLVIIRQGASCAKADCRRNNNDTVIQLIRRRLRYEVHSISGKRKAFIAAIISRFENESIWLTFAKTYRSEYQE